MRRPELGAVGWTLRRWGVDAWPLLQRTAAATVAWIIAGHVAGSHDPFFAPIGAVVALGAPLGERGRNALRLLLGVGLGIVVGELVLLTVDGYGALAIATFTAMALAKALGGAPIIIAQAAVSAILTVTTADDEFGVNRLVDAVIGGGVALVFSQVLFSPEPVQLLRRSEAKVLKAMADGLGMSARAIEEDDSKLAERAVSKLRDLRDSLADLSRLRHAGPRVAKNSAIWRSQIAPVVRETEDAGYLDLLGGTCLLLARVVAETPPPKPKTLAQTVKEFADVLSDLATKLGDRSARQRAADRALEAARRVAAGDAIEWMPGDAMTAVRMIAVDIMTFAGADPEDAHDAAQDGAAEINIPAPSEAPRLPFRFLHRRRG
jgi:hypothetical protein